MIILNDLHLGVNRAAGTTAQAMRCPQGGVVLINRRKPHKANKDVRLANSISIDASIKANKPLYTVLACIKITISDTPLTKSSDLTMMPMLQQSGITISSGLMGVESDDDGMV